MVLSLHWSNELSEQGLVKMTVLLNIGIDIIIAIIIWRRLVIAGTCVLESFYLQAVVIHVMCQWSALRYSGYYSWRGILSSAEQPI